MKKYSSYKSIKPLNTSTSNANKIPLSPTHSSSYRKLGTIELSNQRPTQKHQIYPLSAKYSNYALYSASNINRKKMFSSKNHQAANRPLTLNKQDENVHAGYSNIRTKINDLQNRLNEIKKNYDSSYNARKISQKSNSKVKQNHSITKINIKNKENQLPKQKKTQSKLLLERYQNNKKLKNVSSASTINLNNIQMKPNNEFPKQSLSPLSPKNISTTINLKNIQIMPKSPKDQIQQNYPSPLKPILSPKQSQPSNGQQQQQQQNSYLKQYVTTFTCDNKLPLSHSSSETNLYKPMNKLYKPQGVNKNQYYVSAIMNAFESSSNNPQTSFQNLCRQHLISSLDILSYIKNTKKQPSPNFTCKSLPPVKDNKHTIIFDLDQTLIHCNQNLNIQHDIALPIKFPNGAVLKAGINIRPYAKECLKQLSKYFQLIVFTASHQCYGNVIVDYLDPKKEFISYRYFRDSCFKTEEGFYVKDLRVVDRDLRKVLLVDNAAYSYCFQLENGVPIIPFYDNRADLQLKNLITYLKTFINSKQVKTKNQSEFKLTQYANFKDVKTLINKLYSTPDSQ